MRAYRRWGTVVIEVFRQVIGTSGHLGAAGEYISANSVNLFYHGSQGDFEKTFAQFIAIPGGNQTLSALSYYEVNQVLPPGGERTFSVSLEVCRDRL